MALLGACCFVHGALAQSPSPTVIPFQGRLTDQQGAVMNNGQYTIVFQLYDLAVGGNVLWNERHERVGVVNGMLNVFLGSIAPLTNVTFSETRYLGITVDADNNANTADPEMVPRQVIIPAFWAKNSEKLAGYDWSSLLVSGNDPAAGLLRGDKLAAGSVRMSSLHPDAMAALSATLVQGLAGLAAGEAISDRDAVAYRWDGTGAKLIRASASSAASSALFGFAVGSVAAGQPVAAHQYGPLGGFTALVPGRSYYLNTNLGGITPIYPTGLQVYVGHALSDTTLFVDPFGVSRNWSSIGNYWGNRSDGALVTSGNVSFPVGEDGEVVVKQFSSLTINAGDTVNTQNRCRGLVIYVDGDATINGTLSMTARGANVDPTQPNSISATGIRLVRRQSGGSDTLAASDLGGSGSGGVGETWRAVEALQAGAFGNGRIFVVERGGGEGGAGVGSDVFRRGNPGQSKPNATGGGGGGVAMPYSIGGGGGNGSCYSGGSGGGSGDCAGAGTRGADNGGAGGRGSTCNGGGAVSGGAGNPGGWGGHVSGENGTGGVLILIVKGNLRIGLTGLIAADGKLGGNGILPGGSSGGGRVIVLYGTGFQSTGQVRAKGGVAVTSASGDVTNVSGQGGDGAVTIDKIDP